MSLFKDSIVNIAGRLVAIFSSFVSVFLLGRLFSIDEFGFWTWLFSMFSLINAQDFGFVAAMRVKIGEFFATGDENAQKLWFASGLGLTIMTVLILLFGYAFYGRDIGRPYEDHYIASLLVITCSLFTVLGMCFSHALMACLQSIWVGLGEGLRALLQVTALTIAYVFDAGFMSTLSLFYGLTMLYTPFVACAFMRSKGWTVSSIFDVVYTQGREVINSAWMLLCKGWILWFSQIGLALLSISDVFLAGLFLPESEVAYVNVMSRLVLVGVGIVGASLVPLPGHFINQMLHWDKPRVLRELSRLMATFFMVGLAYSVFLMMFGPNLVIWWSTLVIDQTACFFMAGMLFSVMASVALMQIFMQFSSYALIVLPGLFGCIFLKVLLTFWLAGIYGYVGVFYASFMANFVFLSINFYLLFGVDRFNRLVVNNERSGE